MHVYLLYAHTKYHIIRTSNKKSVCFLPPALFQAIIIIPPRPLLDTKTYEYLVGVVYLGLSLRGLVVR